MFLLVQDEISTASERSKVSKEARKFKGLDQPSDRNCYVQYAANEEHFFTPRK